MKHKGFTIVELLVSIGILLTMFGLGLVNYFNFRDEQKMTQSKNMVKEAVIDAQNAARSGRLFGCDQLDSYEMAFANDAAGYGTITLRPVCSQGATTESKDYNLSEGITFTGSPQPLSVLPVNGVFDISDPATITLHPESGVDESLCIHRSGIVQQGVCP